VFSFEKDTKIFFKGWQKRKDDLKRFEGQIFLGTNIPKRENIPNDRKLYQMAKKYKKWL
jgi:hypothetical protein